MSNTKRKRWLRSERGFSFMFSPLSSSAMCTRKAHFMNANSMTHFSHNMNMVKWNSFKLWAHIFWQYVMSEPTENIIVSKFLNQHTWQIQFFLQKLYTYTSSQFIMTNRNYRTRLQCNTNAEQMKRRFLIFNDRRC